MLIQSGNGLSKGSEVSSSLLLTDLLHKQIACLRKDVRRRYEAAAALDEEVEQVEIVGREDIEASPSDLPTVHPAHHVQQKKIRVQKNPVPLCVPAHVIGTH